VLNGNDFDDSYKNGHVLKSPELRSKWAFFILVERALDSSVGVHTLLQRGSLNRAIHLQWSISTKNSLQCFLARLSVDSRAGRVPFLSRIMKSAVTANREVTILSSNRKLLLRHQASINTEDLIDLILVFCKLDHFVGFVSWFQHGKASATATSVSKPYIDLWFSALLIK